MQPVLHMGFLWDTNEMSVLLAAKLGGPLRGKMARIVINSVHVKGDVSTVAPAPLSCPSEPSVCFGGKAAIGGVSLFVVVFFYHSREPG